MVDKKSDKLKLNKADGLKILKGCGIAMGGALLTYVAEVLPNVDFGQYTAIAVAIGGIIINAGWKLMKGK